MIFLILFPLFFCGAYFSYNEQWALYDFSRDSLILFLSLAWYRSTPMRSWRIKITSTISVCLSLWSFIYNILLDIEFIPEGMPAAFSISVIALCAMWLCFSLLYKFDNHKSDEIEPGYIYEIIGKPRLDIQMIWFVFSGGHGGSYAITEGKTCIYFCRVLRKSIKEELDHSYLKGKKIIKLCKSTPENVMMYDSKANRRFNIWRNCYWLTQGFVK